MRIVDPVAIASARKTFCELCRATGQHQGPYQIHHLRSVGSGGNDERSNLACICWRCHEAVHRDPNEAVRLRQIVGQRESMEQGV